VGEASAGGASGRQWLRLHWIERGVAMPGGGGGTPPRRGFGLDLLETMLPYELLGETRPEFGPDGVRCFIELPLERSATDASAAPVAPGPAAAPAGEGKAAATASIPGDSAPATSGFP
jgi:hypothetical protein